MSMDYNTLSAGAKRNYYTLWFRLHNRDAYLLWFSGTDDGVVLEGRQIRAFADVGGLKTYAALHNFDVVAEQPILHDLDRLKWWLSNPSAETIDCNNFLSAWNLFSDVSASLNMPFEPLNERLTHLYDSLFYGSNVPAITLLEYQYQPIWLEADVELLIDILSKGLELLQQHLVFC